MLDKRSIAVLRTLNKLTEGSAYKVITGDEIISNLAQKSQFDLDSIKQILEFLEKQEYINIKFSEENTYCYSLLPKARICLEQESWKKSEKKQKIQIMNYVFVMISSFIGCLLALIIFFFIV